MKYNFYETTQLHVNDIHKHFKSSTFSNFQTIYK